MSKRPGRVTRDMIEQAYRESGNDLGWRLLTSPARTLDGAEIAFLGLNPGGRVDPPDHPDFAPAKGSAYVTESWAGAPPGESPLQRQVRALFDRLGVAPQNVLSGNLVPFRSPDWARLRDAKGSLAFGESLWHRILARARPTLIIAMGAAVAKALTRMFVLSAPQRVPLGWGRVSGRVWETGDRRVVALPHLSRFGLIERPQSQSGLAALFGDRWQT